MNFPELAIAKFFYVDILLTIGQCMISFLFYQGPLETTSEKDLSKLSVLLLLLYFEKSPSESLAGIVEIALWSGV